MLKKSFRKIKNENGFTGQDLLIAMFILVLFLGIMTGIYVNLSNTSYEIKLAAEATEVVTNVMEYFEGCYYDEEIVQATSFSGSPYWNGNFPAIDYDTWVSIYCPVCHHENYQTVRYYYENDDDDIVDFLQIRDFICEGEEEYCGSDLGFNLADKDMDRYKVFAKIDEDEDAEVKNITVWVEYDWKGETQRIENSMVKRKENIKPQNSPNLTDYNLTPIKYVYFDTEALEGHWVVTDSSDSEWYNYENKRWAIAVENAEFDSETNELISCDRAYVWIPKYYTNPQIRPNNLYNINFQYKDTIDIIDSSNSGSLKIENNMTENSLFSEGTGSWLEIKSNYVETQEQLNNEDSDDNKKYYYLNNSEYGAFEYEDIPIKTGD